MSIRTQLVAVCPYFLFSISFMKDKTAFKQSPKIEQLMCCFCARSITVTVAIAITKVYLSKENYIPGVNHIWELDHKTGPVILGEL